MKTVLWGFGFVVVLWVVWNLALDTRFQSAVWRFLNSW